MVSELTPEDLPADQRIQDLEILLETLREDAEVAHVLLGLSGVLAEVRSIEETLDLAVDAISEIFKADRVFAATTSVGRGYYGILANRGFDEKRLEALRTLAGGGRLPILTEAVARHSPVLIRDTATDPMVEELKAHRGVAAYIALPLVRWGEEFGGLGLEFDAPRNFGKKEFALARGIAQLLDVALVNARRFSMLSSLRSFGLSVARKLSLSSVIEDVAWGAVELLSGDSAKVYFLDSTHKSLVEAGGFESDPPLENPIERIDLHVEPWLNLLEGRAVVSDVGTTDQPLSVVAAPIPGDLSPILGAVLVFFRRHLTGSPDELEALSVLANQAGMAVENANRYERQRQVARSLQEGLLAAEMPELEGCDIEAIYEPASGDKDIGGDFYDVFLLPNGHYALAVGDVSGKGAEAAARTAMVKYMMRAFATSDPSPASVLHNLNDALTRDLEDERFATLVYGVLDPEALKFTIGRAGHPPPLVFRAEDKTVEALEEAVEGPVLGCLEDQVFTEATFALAEGDIFLLYTDGLIEARSDTAFYGRRRVEESLRRYGDKLSIKDLVRTLYREAAAFGEVGDDTVVFALSCSG